MLNGLPGKRPIGVDEELRKRVEQGEDVVVDLRDHLSYGGAHIPGSFGIGEGPGLSTWASWVVPYDTPVLLVSDRPERLEETIRALVRVGLDEVKGYIKGGIEAWGEAGYLLRGLKQTTPIELFKGLQERQDLLLLDVRTDEEWKAAHVEGAIKIMAGELKENLDRLPNTGKELAVMCEMGYRSTVAASVLERGGFERLVNVTGGMRGWKKAGLPVING